jgi:hypothetical protein
MITCHLPELASTSVVALPRPEEAPVMMTVLRVSKGFWKALPKGLACGERRATWGAEKRQHQTGEGNAAMRGGLKAHKAPKRRTRAQHTQPRRAAARLRGCAVARLSSARGWQTECRRKACVRRNRVRAQR